MASISGLRDDFDCPLCLKIFYQPISLHCGHTFCRGCIKRSLNLQPHCPVCRTSTYLDPAHVSPNYLITDLIAKCYPDEAKQRAIDHVAEEEELNSQRLGLFYLPNTEHRLFPGMPIELLVYESRYLLLMQRCLDNASLFGIQPGPDVQTGAAIKIDSARRLHNGRLIITAKVTKRYRVLGGVETEDGTYGLQYAGVQFFEDDPIPPTTIAAAAGTTAAQHPDGDRHDNDDADGNHPAANAGWRGGRRLVDGVRVDDAGSGNGNSNSNGIAAARAGTLAAMAETYPELDQLSPRSQAALRRLTESQAAAQLRDVLSEAVTRMTSSLAPHAVRAFHARYGQPPTSSGPGSAADRWSMHIAAVAALGADDRRLAFETTKPLRRLIICYKALEAIEQDFIAASTPPSSAPTSGAASTTASASAVQVQRNGIGLTTLSLVDAQRGLDMLAGMGSDSRLMAMVRAATTSAAFSSILVLVIIFLALYILRHQRQGQGLVY